jgi:hypothetical protein
MNIKRLRKKIETLEYVLNNFIRHNLQDINFPLNVLDRIKKEAKEYSDKEIDELWLPYEEWEKEVYYDEYYQRIVRDLKMEYLKENCNSFNLMVEKKEREIKILGKAYKRYLGIKIQQSILKFEEGIEGEKFRPLTEEEIEKLTPGQIEINVRREI